MKKILKSLKFLAVLMIFASCSNGSEDNFSSKTKDGAAKKSSYLSFNMSSLQALAIADSAASSISRAAVSDSTDGKLVKIMENGSIEDFIGVPSGVSLAPVKYIAQSPKEDSLEIYIVFDYDKYISVKDEFGNYKNVKMGQLLCVLSDGTYYDILATDDDTSRCLGSNDNNEPIFFDKNGNMYYLVVEWSGSNNTNMIYKFDSASGKSTQLTQAIANTYYNKLQVSNDGEWIFAQGYRYSNSNNTTFLRAIPTANPSQVENLIYDSTGSYYINNWCYDDDAECVYAIKGDSILKFPKTDGTFSSESKETLFSSNSGNRYFHAEDLISLGSVVTIYKFATYQNTRDIFDKDNDGTTGDGVYYYFRNPQSEEHEEQPEEIAKFLLAKACDSLKSEYKDEYISGVTAENSRYKLCFDSFANIEGFELLASLTAGKSNTEAIQAVIDNNLESVLVKLWGENARYAQDPWFSYTEHNFFQDILYEYNSKTESWEQISSEKFRVSEHNSAYFESAGIHYGNLFSPTGSTNCTWNSNLLDEENNVDAELVLKKLASYCSTSSIDFSLEVFKNKNGYTGLYTDKKNEEAIKFLDNPVRLQLLYEYINSISRDSDNGPGEFIKETCFKKDTTESAYTLRTTDNETIWWAVSQLTTSKGKSLYGIYKDGSAKAVVIKIIDEDGNAVGSFVSGLDTYSVSECLSASDGFYFKTAILDASGSESGNHTIYYYDVETEETSNLFTNVENGSSSEVISFSAGDGYLFYCISHGFDISTGKIDVATKEVTKLSTTQKLTQILVIK